MGGAVKVYGVGASPFVATVLLCLEETGADYELVPLDMAAREQRTEPHLSRNPFGKIPVLEDGELTLFDQAVVDENVGKLEKVLDVYEARLSTHAYLAGDFFSLADLLHFGITYYLVAGTEYATLLESRANVSAWWGRIMARPSVKKVAQLIHLWLKPSSSA
ncbi:unnamed protein product [Triticum turgidum subsp. durum]|uniref:glutathione transferase n=1 Tax=Triticum turgidum subsp. durum TaxID=4567 RepID=A0A9R0QPU5_TRITD|nr:unnamed protein product [Triticum turgidum subsp. durum]